MSPVLHLMHLLSDGMWQLRTTFGPVNQVARLFERAFFLHGNTSDPKADGDSPALYNPMRLTVNATIACRAGKLKKRYIYHIYVCICQDIRKKSEGKDKA